MDRNMDQSRDRPSDKHQDQGKHRKTLPCQVLEDALVWVQSTLCPGVLDLENILSM